MQHIPQPSALVRSQLAALKHMGCSTSPSSECVEASHKVLGVSQACKSWALA